MNFKLFFLLFCIIISESVFSVETTGLWNRVNFKNNDVLIYIPKNYFKKTEVSPLMVNLHGCGQSIDHLRDGGNWEYVAEKYNMLVVLPAVPDGGVLLGCWNYYGPYQSINNEHPQHIIRLIESLMSNKKLHIDKERIYLSGLSSGATEAAIIGCLRPDLISGLALNSTPVIGTTMYELQQPFFDTSSISNLCQKWAEDKASFIARQKVTMIFGSTDVSLNPNHSRAMGAAYAQLFKVKHQISIFPNQLPGYSKTTIGYILQNEKKENKVAIMSSTTLGHNWASGPLLKPEISTDKNAKSTNNQSITESISYNYINPYSMNFPLFSVDFFNMK